MALLAVPVALAAVSFLDDLRGLPVAVRFVCHLAALLLPAHYGAGAAIVVAIAIAWMMNACNFMDGSDGMAGGMALAGFGTYGVLAWWAGDATLATVSFSLAAAAAGFLVFNFHPARIFLGDAGSVPLGFLAAVLGLAGWTNGSWSLWIPLVVFSPFIADASLTLARRVFCGERFWQAHHDNYYQRLIRMGWSHRATALAALAAMPGAAALAAAISRESGSTQATWSLVWFGLLGALMLAIGLRWQRR
jgi:UDP-N-acetylmuramyl pentapeptide phosphotransferase/UDP-N-acetylglucosamine-1-phosphate transferase